ncbi:glycine/D-amino acid oxidase, deaminating [Thermanaerovibrio velox DSM 12556]|uniref:Glycine/D-amino acid oxidase, deaminating n=1 Tax=Thermanaerovibrio velox DSM 12556 TaxID=926567 RepID=H0UR07_9BACT|nr:FAD-binding oxidoreductase [Thermanaerovibrio velox]EHM10844.1 glycine/D-amino acid oxidase, deaminating [Thermanaerovibrio velox DSM 12556]
MGKSGGDVIVVGGGVHGCSAAYELAKAGFKVTLFEGRYLSAGGSGRSAAGIRQHFGTEVNCRLAMYNVQVFRNLQEELRCPLDLEFTQWGYLWVAYTDRSLGQLRLNVELQNSLGIPSEILDPEEIRSRWGYLKLDGVIGGAFCAEDGHINPHGLTIGYAEAAKRHGALVMMKSPVDRVLVRGDRVAGVSVMGEEWHAPVVLLAAGPWSAPLAASAGVELPVAAERHQILVTEPVEPFGCPMVLCLDDGAYFKQCPNGTFLIGRDDPLEPKTCEVQVSPGFLEGVCRSVLQRMPILKGVRVVRQWSGPYDITPDRQAIIDWTPVEGLMVNCGWSGHGLQFAPSGGRLVREMLQGVPTFVDIRPFRLSRFEEGDLFPEPACI